MVKYVKFINGSGEVHKMSEKEYDLLINRGERLKVVKSVTRKSSPRSRPSTGNFLSGFRGF